MDDPQSVCHTKSARCGKGTFNLVIFIYSMSIPQKYSVTQVIGFIRGKSAIHIARMYLGHKKRPTMLVAA